MHNTLAMHPESIDKNIYRQIPQQDNRPVSNTSNYDSPNRRHVPAPMYHPSHPMGGYPVPQQVPQMYTHYPNYQYQYQPPVGVQPMYNPQGYPAHAQMPPQGYNNIQPQGIPPQPMYSLPEAGQGYPSLGYNQPGIPDLRNISPQKSPEKVVVQNTGQPPNPSFNMQSEQRSPQPVPEPEDVEDPFAVAKDAKNSESFEKSKIKSIPK